MGKFLTFTQNLHGRDFICSDIHGHFYLLEEKLEDCGFDKNLDRLFCLGDLIDRGEDSILAFDYLEESWFYSILGNHEIMLIDAYESNNDIAKQQWYSWGGEWAQDLSDNDLANFYQSLIQQPIAIELAITNHKKVGLVHANLPAVADWSDIASQLKELPNKHFSYNPLLFTLLWSKASIADEEKMQTVSGIDHIFHGHTIKEQITTIKNRSFLDLGSYRNFNIGFIEPNKFLTPSN
ncbi:metallophosphoesterase [Aliikangiella sp. IMCC44359]|uniref:metallophosphoesterase n=1 Tax=Aliikangiella sp. IMCC44359 TaxID=3459125 RepID=UPI00403AC1B1